MIDRPIYDPSPIGQEFHLCDADEALVGGSGGPGKSLMLLMDPIQAQMIYEHERFRVREIRESEGKAIHFRREFPMLTETLDRAHRIFPKLDPKVHWDGEARTFRFQCGYKYQFAHLKDAKDWQIYDSNQYCVAKGTPILMGDRSWSTIEKVMRGDEVMTLEGPRRVLNTMKPRVTFCVRADVYLGRELVGSQVQPSTHPVLTSAEVNSTRRWLRNQNSVQSTQEFRTWLDYESLLYGRQESPAKRASSIGAGSGSEASGDSRRDASLLPALTVPVVLHALSVRSAGEP